jgi:hypothetical protein
METHGDAGVQVLVDEKRIHPERGPGRFTFKKYHLGSRLPNWLCTVLPKTALVLDENAWRLGTYTRTEVSKFHKCAVVCCIDRLTPLT